MRTIKSTIVKRLKLIQVNVCVFLLVIGLIFAWEERSMAKPNTIVGSISQIEPLWESDKTSPTGWTVHFSAGQTVRLAPDNPHSISDGELLDSMRQAGIPAYVEFDPENQAIMRVLVPLVVTISNIVPSEDGQFLVELEISSARHTLSPTNPNFERLLTALEEARQGQTQVFVTETDNHEIIDVRPVALP